MLAGGTFFAGAPAAADVAASHQAAHRSPQHPVRHPAHKKPASRKKATSREKPAPREKHRARPKQRHARPEKHARLSHRGGRERLPRNRPPRKHPARPKPPTPRRLAEQGRWQLRIPGIGVTSRLLSLGDPHGPVLSVPAISQASEAAWYNFSAVPGSPGNAVVVGHVDTYTGPAVFYDLYELRRGDPVYVSIGGRQVRFAVDGVTEVQKDLFPVKRIFGPTSSRRLWIITCGGSFDYTTRHYTDNIIVSASYEPVHRNDGTNTSHTGKRLP